MTFSDIQKLFNAVFAMKTFKCFKKRIIFFLCLLNCRQAISDFDSIFKDLSQKGFRCERMTSGAICQVDSIQLSNSTAYSESLGILLPSNLQALEEVIYYLHGFRDGGPCMPHQFNSIDLSKKFHLLEHLLSAGKGTSVIVFPTSKGKSETYNLQLIPNFNLIHQWLLIQLNTQPIKYRIAGHSGAGKIISILLSQNPKFALNTKAALLLDASYGIPNRLNDWKIAFQTNPNLIIYSNFIKGSATENGSILLQKTFGKQSVVLTHARSQNHCMNPYNELEDQLRISN